MRSDGIYLTNKHKLEYVENMLIQVVNSFHEKILEKHFKIKRILEEEKTLELADIY